MKQVGRKQTYLWETTHKTRQWCQKNCNSVTSFDFNYLGTGKFFFEMAPCISLQWPFALLCLNQFQQWFFELWCICYKLIQRFRVTGLFAGQHNTCVKVWILFWANIIFKIVQLTKTFNQQWQFFYTCSSSEKSYL